MLRLTGIRITLTRGETPARRRRRGAPAVAVLAMATGAFALTGISAKAVATPVPNPNQVNAQVNVSPPVKSVTVNTPNSVMQYVSCSGGSSTATQLGFPNARCSTAAYSVLDSGNVTETIAIQGSNAVPSDNGTQWKLCGGSGTGCVGPSSLPGLDQYENQVQFSNAGLSNLFLTNNAQSAETLNAQQSDQESLTMVGPQSPTDSSGSFTLTVVYTAL